MPRDKVDKLIAEIGICRAYPQLYVAAILFTYRCTIACRHCCFGCSTSRPDVVMDPEKCVRYLGDLHELGRVIHIAGGEAMMYWPQLLKALEIAAEKGVQPHFIESNCSFAVSDEICRERFGLFRSMGIQGMLFSADPYHQEHVPPERFIRARRIAFEFFGEQNVACSRASDDEIRALPEITRDEARLREYARKHPSMFVGSAFDRLSRYMDEYPVESLPNGRGWHLEHSGQDCATEFNSQQIWEIHIDPYDNAQTNCGVILGRADETPVAEMVSRGLRDANFITRILSEGGPLGLARWAAEMHGFAIPRTAVSKCGLCFLTRRFLRQFYPEILGPAEVYC
ncbi:MAG TPA: radical SAM protein [Candidatus Brocadiia bacterium]|nr:radical SAM protein [Candidatus Brocadiia bacterium]